MSSEDNKHAKYAAQQEQRGFAFRRLSFYILLSSYLADCYASRGGSMMHLTLWSYLLHLLYFELPLQQSSPTMTLLLHGPSFSGAHALFAMYLWTLYANPDMEFQLAPYGRAVWLVYARAFWLHAGPVILHWMDIVLNKPVLEASYGPSSNSNFLYFWASVGGYFAMGLTWEQVNGDASGTYRIESMSEETYVNVSKALGILACIGSFLYGTKAHLLDS